VEIIILIAIYLQAGESGRKPGEQGEGKKILMVAAMLGFHTLACQDIHLCYSSLIKNRNKNLK
jgi:hypothetical protein